MTSGVPGQGFMYGAWNPVDRVWSGRWSHEKNFSQGPLREFSFSPKPDTSVLPKNPCEQCRSYINAQDKYYGCSMCDKWGVHTKCFSAQLPYTCSSCLEWIKRYGSIPPLARTWIGFSDQSMEPNGPPTRIEDAIRMEFQYKSEGSANPTMMALISGRGENALGHYSVKGYISKSKSGEGYEMKIVRQYESMSGTSAASSASSQQQQPQSLSGSSSAAYAPPPASSSSNARAPRRKADEATFEDPVDKRPRMNGGSMGSGYATPKRTATLVTSVGVEGNISSLVDVWRAVAKINDPSIGIVCLSAPATTLPLKAMLRLYNNSDQLSQILRSSSAMAACSSACTAVDVALETACATMSCASLDRKSQYAFPCAVAAAYAVDKYGKSVVAVDLCPKPTYLLNALQNTSRVNIMAPAREPNNVRSWQDAINGVVSNIRMSMPDILMLSTVLGEFDPGEYAYAMESFAALRLPFVVVVEDVTNARAMHCAQAMMEVLARKYNGEVGAISSISQQQAAPSSASGSSASAQTYALPGGPSTMYKSSGQQLGMYQSLVMSATPQPNKSSGGAPSSVPQGMAPGKPPSMGEKPKNPPGAAAYGSAPNKGMAPPQGSNNIPGKPSLGISVTPPTRAGMPPQPHQGPSGMSNAKSNVQPHSTGNKNGGMPPMPPYPSRSTSNGSASGMYASPGPMQKQLSGRQPSPPRSNGAPPASTYASDPFFDELSGDALEPLPFHPIEDLPVSSGNMPSGGSASMNSNNGNGMGGGGNSMPPPIPLPQAPPLDRQDSWDLGAESPRPHSKQFDYITASFKS